ncbi:hypothetical protein FDB29_08945 [Clostridium botulinum]|nr:hypothetical protein [Clostridium botulinum]
MIKDTSFEDIKRYKKYKDIFNIKSIEVLVSLISAIIFTFVIINIINNSNYEDINNLIRSLTKDIAIALIGLLGFIVTGLAILTSAISNKLMNIIHERKKTQTVERILLSFYLLGLIIGITIMLEFFLYLISFFSININLCLFGMVTFIVTYLVTFILFYAVALIGNCVQIFSIINIPKQNESCLKKEDRELFDSFRISTLERLVFISDALNGKEKIKEYRKIMDIIIEDLSDEEQKEKLKMYLDYHLGNDR